MDLEKNGWTPKWWEVFQLEHYIIFQEEETLDKEKEK